MFRPGLNFHWAMMRLIGGICRSVPEFSQIRVSSLQVSASFNRSRTRHGLIAYVVPMKYRGGAPVEVRTRGSKQYHWAMLPLFQGEQQVLYRVYFMLPRFLNLSLRDKLETVIHELYHIHPDGNGDLRRFPGRSPLHGDMAAYDRKVQQLADQFLDSPGAALLVDFLSGTEKRIADRFGPLDACHLKEPRPRLLKVTRLSS